MTNLARETDLADALAEVERLRACLQERGEREDERHAMAERLRAKLQLSEAQAAHQRDIIRGFNTLLGWSMTSACSGDVTCWCDAHKVIRGETPTEPLSPSALIPGAAPAAKRKRATSPELERQAAEIWAHQEKLRREVIFGSRPLDATPARIRNVIKLLKDGVTVEDCKAVLEAVAANCRRDASQSRWFNGDTTWVPKNFTRTLGMIGSRGPRAGGVLEAIAESVAEAEERERDISEPQFCPYRGRGHSDDCACGGMGGDR